MYKSTALKKYKLKAFTLLELLVVMAIIGSLIALSWAAFFGLRTTMLLNQSAESLRADIVYAQRASMLLNRDTGDKWIYGIGVDLRNMSSVPRKYTIFKWCSMNSSYEDFTTVPPNDVLHKFKSTTLKEYVDCEIGDGLDDVSGKKDIQFSSQQQGFDSGSVRYIVFESVTGIPHFYNGSGDPIAVEEAVLKTTMRNRWVKVKVNQNSLIKIERGAD